MTQKFFLPKKKIRNEIQTGFPSSVPVMRAKSFLACNYRNKNDIGSFGERKGGFIPAKIGGEKNFKFFIIKNEKPNAKRIGQQKLLKK